MSNPNPPTSPPRVARALRWWGILALIGYGLFLALNFSNIAGGADSSGYLNSARLLADGALAAELRVPAEFGPQAELRRQQFQPHGFVPFEGNPRLSPTYPSGLPLHLALAAKIVGWNAAAPLTGVLVALAAIGLTYQASRRFGVEAPLAAAGAIVLAAYPVFLFMSIQPLSDTLATTWCLAAVIAAEASRRRPALALAAGFALAVAVLVRATNALLLPALVVLIGLHARRLALAVLGGLPGACWLGYYNHVLYGSALRSGYVDITDAFGWSYGAPTLLHFAQWLALMLPPVLLVLPALARSGGTERRVLVALALWFAAFVGLYAFYSISHEVWWDLRFILPGTPALIIAGLLGLQALLARRSGGPSPRLHAVAAAMLAVWAVALGAYWTQRYHLLLTPVYEQTYADSARAATQHFPANTLVVAGQQSGALYYYTEFPVLRWEFVNPEEFREFQQKAQGAGRAIGAVLYDFEQKEALQEKCPGNWQPIATVRNVTLWRLEATAPLAAGQ